MKDSMQNVFFSRLFDKRNLSLNQRQRWFFIDACRVLAIILMVIFHGAYDLRIFDYNQIDFQRNYFWWFLPRVIVFLFLFSMGMSLEIAHIEGIKWKTFWRRFFPIAGAAIMVSLVTYFMFPKRWIYFGTLHCIALSSLCALPLLKRPWICLILGSALMIPHMAEIWTPPFIKLYHRSMDYIPLLPWIGIVFWGMGAVHFNIHRLFAKYQLPGVFKFAAKHSLMIYLLHQPLLFGCIKLYHSLTSP